MSNNNSGKVELEQLVLKTVYGEHAGEVEYNAHKAFIKHMATKLEAYISSKVNEERSFAEFYMTNESRKKYRYHIKEHDKDSDRIRTLKVSDG